MVSLKPIEINGHLLMKILSFLWFKKKTAVYGFSKKCMHCYNRPTVCYYISWSVWTETFVSLLVKIGFRRFEHCDTFYQKVCKNKN